MKRFLGLILALGWLFSAAPVPAQVPMTHAGLGAPGGSVVLSSSTGAIINKDITIGTATATPLGTSGPTLDTTAASVSFWAFGTRSNSDPAGGNNIANGFQSTMTWGGAGGNALFGTNTGGCEAVNTNARGLCLAILDNSAAGCQYNFNNGTNPSTTGIDVTGPSATGCWVNGQWNHVVAGFKQGSCFLYLNRASIGTCPGNIATAVTVALDTADGLFIGNGQSSKNWGWVQDIYYDNTYIGCTGVGAPQADCTGNNTIAPSVLNKLNSGGMPVDLGATCSTVTGSQPTICLTGNSTDMQTNKGYATGLALRQASGSGGTIQGGALSTGTRIDDAPYPATGIPSHVVRLKHAFGWLSPFRGPCATSTTTGCFFANSAGGTENKPNSGTMPLAIGDVRMLIIVLSQTVGATDHAVVCPTTASGAWTALRGAVASTDLFYAAVCTITVTSALEEDQVPGFSWTGTSDAGGAWVMLTYTNVASIQDSHTVTQARSTTLTSPVANTGASACHLINIWTAQDSANRSYTYSGTGKVTTHNPFATGGGEIYTVEEDVASGAAMSRNLTDTVSRQTVAFNYCLVPN